MQHKDAIPKLQSAKHINPNIDIYSNSHLSLRFFLYINSILCAKKIGHQYLYFSIDTVIVIYNNYYYYLIHFNRYCMLYNN